jgi:YfiH family protein
VPAKSQPKKSRTEKSPSSQIQLLRSETLDFPWLVHSFSTRAGGVSRGGTLNLGFTKNDSRAAVERNRNLFLKATGAEGLKSVSMRQIHSDIIHHISDIPISPLVGDGVITNTPGLLLSIQTADCLPILLADPKKRAVGAFHAGWRGTLARVVEKGIGEMRRQFGSNPRDLRAAIGPGIHKCCYQVGPEVREVFHSRFVYSDELFHEQRESDVVHEKYPLLFMNARAPGHGPDQSKLYLDLVAANTRQLLDTGVLAKNISVSPLCTSCRADLLFSYRAEKGGTGRLMGVIGIRP